MQLCLSCIDSDGREACVWFTDMRYDLLALADTFRYGPSRDGLEVGYEVKFVSGTHRAAKVIASRHQVSSTRAIQSLCSAAFSTVSRLGSASDS